MENTQLYSILKSAIADGSFTYMDFYSCDNDDLEDYVTDLYSTVYDRVRAALNNEFDMEPSIQAGRGKVSLFSTDMSGVVCWDYQQELKAMLSIAKQAATESEFITQLTNWYLEKISHFVPDEEIWLDV